ncbi:MAG: hypothetical protein IT538_09330 [Variibacter sp.]|nr:hypothetical protein [Variibacter sp.]
MSLELMSIGTDTYPLDGAFYEPAGGAPNGAVVIMHGNSSNFHTGVPRTLVSDCDRFYGGRETAAMEPDGSSHHLKRAFRPALSRGPS